MLSVDLLPSDDFSYPLPHFINNEYILLLLWMIVNFNLWFWLYVQAYW